MRDYTENSNSSTHPPVAGPEWSYPNASLPCAFASDTKVRVTAKFEGCPDGVVYVKGDGPANYDLPTKLLVNGIYEATELTTKFAASKIDFFENFEIKWYFGATANGPWMEAGTSFNPLYVIRPVEAPDMDFYHTLLYYGCKYGKGHTTDVAIVDNTYNKVFVPKKLLRRDEPTKVDGMSYWGLDNPQNTDYCWTTSALLRYEDGRCGAWADFMLQMLKVQGIDSKIGGIYPIKKLYEGSIEYTNFLAKVDLFYGVEKLNFIIHLLTAKNGVEFIPDCFFVKEWNFLNNSPFYLWDYEYEPYKLNTPPGPILLSNNNMLKQVNLLGTSSQNNSDPQSTFKDHAVVIYNEKLFDPSYGLIVPFGGIDQNQYEQKAMSGYGVGLGDLLFYKFPLLNPILGIMYKLKNETTNIQLKLIIL